MLRAVSAWAQLHPESVLASAELHPESVLATERQLADARAAADVASREQGIRAHEAEQDAMRWKAQYEEKERDLVFAKEQLEVARRNADAGLPTGQYRVEEERRAAVFEAEALLHRLRQGEARANADAEAAAREIDSLRARLRDYENGGGVGGDLAAGNNRVAALQAEIDMKAGEILHMQTQVKHDTARLKLELDAAKRAIHERDVALTQFSTEYDKATADAYRFAADLSSTSHSLDEARGVIVERDRIIQETNDELGDEDARPRRAHEGARRSAAQHVGTRARHRKPHQGARRSAASPVGARARARPHETRPRARTPRHRTAGQRAQGEARGAREDVRRARRGER